MGKLPLKLMKERFLYFYCSIGLSWVLIEITHHIQNGRKIQLKYIQKGEPLLKNPLFKHWTPLTKRLSNHWGERSKHFVKHSSSCQKCYVHHLVKHRPNLGLRGLCRRGLIENLNSLYVLSHYPKSFISEARPVSHHRWKWHPSVEYSVDFHITALFHLHAFHIPRIALTHRSPALTTTVLHSFTFDPIPAHHTATYLKH